MITHYTREKAKRIQATVKCLGKSGWGFDYYGVMGDSGYHHVTVSKVELTCDCQAKGMCSHRLAVLRYRASRRGASLVAFTRNEKHTVSFARALKANRHFANVAARKHGGIYWVEAQRKAA